MITVYIKKIENVLENEKQIIINSLSPSARERLDKKRNKDLHLASLCALSLLTDEQRANLDYTTNGNPFFKNLNQDISISHSKLFAVVAISNSKSLPVGADIEDIDKRNMITTRFFTENEFTNLENGISQIEIWTKKEALFKFLKNDPTPFIKLDSTTPEIYGAQFTTMKIEDSILTICAKETDKIELIQK